MNILVKEIIQAIIDLFEFKKKDEVVLTGKKLPWSNKMKGHINSVMVSDTRQISMGTKEGHYCSFVENENENWAEIFCALYNELNKYFYYDVPPAKIGLEHWVLTNRYNKGQETINNAKKILLSEIKQIIQDHDEEITLNETINIYHKDIKMSVWAEKERLYIKNDKPHMDYEYIFPPLNADDKRETFNDSTPMEKLKLGELEDILQSTAMFNV